MCLTFNDWIQLILMIATVAVAVFAIYGDFFKYLLASPKLELITDNNFKGSFVKFDENVKVIYYHLVVINKRKWSPVKNCEVILKKYAIKQPNGDFIVTELSAPTPLYWTPRELKLTKKNFLDKDRIDFGYLIKAHQKFEPAIYMKSIEFKGEVFKDKVIQYYLEVRADGIKSKYKIFEVSWDGEWIDSAEEMKQHLIIKEILKKGN